MVQMQHNAFYWWLESHMEANNFLICGNVVVNEVATQKLWLIFVAPSGDSYRDTQFPPLFNNN